MTVVRVPKPPAQAQNPDRRLSDLLKAQLDHFHHAEERYFSNIKTEGEAANYIRHVTSLLHPEGAEAEQSASRITRPLVRSVPTIVRRTAAAVVIDAIAAQADKAPPAAIRDAKPQATNVKSKPKRPRSKTAKKP
jgi:hypothetical protein